KALAAGGEPGEADKGCDGEGDRQQLEGRQAARPGGEEREQRPEQHRHESDQGGAKSSIVGHGRRLRQGWQATARPYAAAGAASSAPTPGACGWPPRQMPHLLEITRFCRHMAAMSEQTFSKRSRPFRKTHVFARKGVVTVCKTPSRLLF